MEIIDFKDLGIMIPKDRVFLSFDISTSCIGVSIFNENFELRSVKALKMTKTKDCQEDVEIVKGDGFKKFVEELKIYEIIDIFVEEPLVKSNNVYTVNKLLKLQATPSKNRLKFKHRDGSISNTESKTIMIKLALHLLHILTTSNVPCIEFFH